MTRDWLELLYSKCPGYLVVSAIKGSKVRSTSFATDELDQAARVLEGTAKSGDVYVSCATYKSRPAKGKRGTAADVAAIPGVWADIDLGTAGHQPRAGGLPNPEQESDVFKVLENEGIPLPTERVHSGGGLQYWWLFDEPLLSDTGNGIARVTLGWTAGLVAAFERAGYGMDSLGDPARVLRAPGTWNHKLDEPRPVRWLSREATRYTLAELEPHILPVDVNLTAPNSGAVLDMIVDEFDAFNAHVPWSAILEPHGWTFAGARRGDGAEFWRRPGKDDGHSAVCGNAGVPTLVNFSGTAGLPVGPGHKLTKFRVWSLLEHGGDEKAALRVWKAALAGGGSA